MVSPGAGPFQVLTHTSPEPGGKCGGAARVRAGSTASRGLALSAHRGLTAHPPPPAAHPSDHSPPPNAYPPMTTHPPTARPSPTPPIPPSTTHPPTAHPTSSGPRLPGERAVLPGDPEESLVQPDLPLSLTAARGRHGGGAGPPYSASWAAVGTAPERQDTAHSSGPPALLPHGSRLPGADGGCERSEHPSHPGSRSAPGTLLSPTADTCRVSGLSQGHHQSLCPLCLR